MTPVLVLVVVVAVMLSTQLLWGERPAPTRVLGATLSGIAVSVAVIMVVGGAAMSQAWLTGVSTALIALSAVLTHRGTHPEPGPA